MKNKSHAVTAEMVVPARRRAGVIIAQGGAFAGWSLYAEGRQAGVLLQPARLAALQVEGRRRIPPGEHQVRMEFAYDGGGPGQGRHGDALRRWRATGRGARRTPPCRMVSPPTRPPTSAATPASPVSDDYTGETSVFTGSVNWVQIDLGADAEDADHLISPEERLRVAMARQ